MEHVNWPEFFSAVAALLSAITVAIGIWNKAHIEAVRREQTRVSENSAQVQADGQELRRFLQENGYKAPETLFRSSNEAKRPSGQEHPS